MNLQNENYRIQRVVLLIGVFLFAIKIVAWLMTNSVAILSDALEGIINIVTGFFGLYALYLAKLPRDENHPYGHGKAEFITAGVEGILIGLAGIYIAYEGMFSFFQPKPLARLDIGILLVSVAGVVNYLLGYYALKKGSMNKSIALESTGKHLMFDAYTTLGITLALVVINYTGLLWLDALISILLAMLLMVMGYKIVRKSLSGVMDEADEKLVEQIHHILQNHQKPEWTRFKGIRVIQSGSAIHIDGFVYLPQDFTVLQADHCLTEIHELLVDHFGPSTETAFVVRAAR